MAEGLQIGELPQKENLTGNELIPFQQGSSNGSMSTATLKKYIGTGGGTGGSTDYMNYITEYNVSVQHPTSGIDGSNKYSLEGAIAQVPQELRNIGLKVSFINSVGKVETWEFQGGTFTSIDNWIRQALNVDVENISVNKISSDKIKSNKTIDNSGNIISSQGRCVVDGFDIGDMDYLYTNCYGIYFYKKTENGLTYLNWKKANAATGRNISKIPKEKESNYCRLLYTTEVPGKYFSGKENFIFTEFGVAEVPILDYSKNLITESILIKGYNTVNGSLSVNEEYNTTQLIDIKDAKTVFTNAYSVALFTSDGSYIGYTGNQTDSFRELKINQSPAYRYAVFNFNKNTHAFVSLHYFPCNPNSIDMDSTMNHDEILRMAFSGKKMTSFGDSIVELVSWQKYVWKYFNMADHYNRGIGGSKVTSVGYKNKLVDESGYYHASNPSEGTISIKDYMCGDERVSTIPLDTDILIIYASANDISGSVEIGSIDDGDETHFYYAYALMIRKIIKRIPNAKIFVCTPHNFYNKYENADYPYKNNQNLTILDYCKVIKDIAAIYGIPVIDVNGLSGISTLTITKDLGDQVHPNNIGGQKIANVIINTLIRFAPISLQEPRVEDKFH